MRFRAAVVILAAFPLVTGCFEKKEKDETDVKFSTTDAGLPDVGDGSLAWGDYDGDGDLDLAIAGWRYDKKEQVAEIYYNDAGSLKPVGAGLTPTSGCSLAWGDYDNDGDLDLVVAGSVSSGDSFIPATRIYNNNGGVFSDIGAGIADVHQRCAVAWGDCDNDGDLDLAIAGKTGTGLPIARVYIYEGGTTFTDITAGLPGVFNCALAWGDYDSDEDMDLAIAGKLADGSAEALIYDNDGSGTFTDAGAGLTGVLDCALAWADFDNDGDLDLVLAGYDTVEDEPVCCVYGNSSGIFQDLNCKVTGVRGCSVAFGDCNGDGYLDLAIAGWDENDNVVCEVYLNNSGDFDDDAELCKKLDGIGYSSLAWGDYDGDGDLDLAAAGAWYARAWLCETRIYRNKGTANTAPTSPGGLGTSVAGGNVTFSWSAATDAETTDADGLYYNLRVGTATGTEDVFSGTAVIGGVDDGLRLVPALGNVQQNTQWTLKGLAPGTTYYWSVQAIDPGLAGSAWAVEDNVTP